MTAEILQIRDYQSKRAIERAHKVLEEQAVEIFSTAFPSVFGFGDGIDAILGTPTANVATWESFGNPPRDYIAPEKDGA